MINKNITSADGFNKMVEFLEKYYQRTKLDDLGGLLGSMDPFLWTNKKPIDSCMLRDWNRITQEKDLNEAQLLDAIRMFVKVQQEEFKYDLNSLIKDLDEFSDKKLRKEWEDTLVG
jgi:hypothetical protein